MFFENVGDGWIGVGLKKLYFDVIDDVFNFCFIILFLCFFFCWVIEDRFVLVILYVLISFWESLVR